MLNVAGMKEQLSQHVHENPPKSPPWGDFLSLFCELGLRLRLVAFFSLVKPFADIIGDYASQDGEKE